MKYTRGLVLLVPLAALALAQQGPSGTLVAITNGEPAHLNAAIATTGAIHVVAGSIYNGLVGLDAQGKPVPELAERWEVKDNGRTYRFFLRKGVKWHDGEAFTSSDVKFTFLEMLLKYHARTKAGLEGPLAGIDTPDPNTVVFRFKNPYGPLLRRLDVIEAPILPEHLYKGTDVLTNPVNQKPVGTGPFKFLEWQRGQQITLVRNQNYFRPDKPQLERVVFRIIPNSTTAAAALEKGEADYLWSVDGPQTARLRALPNVTLEKSPSGAGGSYCINTLVPNIQAFPLKNLKVRQAIYHAIDRDFILDRVNFGQGRVANGPIASTLPFYDAKIPKYEFDLERANKILDAVGYPRKGDGVRFKLRFTYAQASFASLADVLKDQLKQAGIDLTLEPLEVNAANERVYIKKDFDLGVASLCGGSDPDIGVKRLLTSRNIGPILFSNGPGYKNPLVDAMLDRAVQTVDDEARLEQYRLLQEQVAKDLPYLWLIETEGYRAYRKAVKNIRLWTSNSFEDATLEEK